MQLPFRARDYKIDEKGNATGHTRTRNPSFSKSAFENALPHLSNDSNFNSIKHTIGKFGDMVEGLAAIRETPNPTMPRAATALKYKERLAQVGKVAEQQLQIAARQLQSAQDNATSQMLAKTKLNQVTGRASEIRATLRQLDAKQRKAFINKSVENGSSEVLAAVLDAPAELSMLSDSEVSQARDFFVAKHAPEYGETMNDLDAAQLRLSLSYDAFLDETGRLRDKGIEEFAENGDRMAKEADATLDALLK